MRIRWFVIIALGLVGAVWVGQGLGHIRGQGLITDDVRWAAIGGARVIVAGVLGLNERRRRRA